MERELWLELYNVARRLESRSDRGIFATSWIVGVFFWAVINDRPVSWACNPINWRPLSPGRLPSQPTMSRRLRSPNVICLMKAMALALQEEETGWLKYVDGKPLPVGGHSKDPDAKWGHGVRNFIKGYKLYAIWADGPLPIVWDVAAVNTSEQSMAEKMIPCLTGGGYLLGDKLYDINKLYEAAGRVGHQLVAARKRPKCGLGWRCHSRHRLRSIELLKTEFGQALYRQRYRVEQHFAHLTNFPGGLAPLPNWVRRLSRVKLWVNAKLLIHAVRSKIRPQTAIAVA